MKHKVGDKVRIKSREWYDKNKGYNGDVDIPCGFTKDMSDLCGKEAVITLVYKRFYAINIDNGEFRWSDEMLDDSFSYNPEKSILSEEIIKDISEVVKKHNLGVSISENDGKLIIEPLKVEDEIKVGEIIVYSYDKKHWCIGKYAGGFTFYKTIAGLIKDLSNYIIPFDKFNPNNIEESLKYNIVKQ